ncbi:NmrA family NAD(P)-binding protein [Taibaiella soli]|uniref:NAD-dependent dehydratase n=1 Tax=Taibaiella soli TaxID=1649169 RepID=A0A2W2B1W7_9BACT|nr:NAD(P)H-binding protein [Taibaiella soli]PZF74254.1 NAD-dependent dehydratase [Taibaiella soli]
MKITVTGSLGNISRVLVEKLTSAGHEVKLISSNAGRVEEIKGFNATPLIGSVADYSFVKSAFEGSDAVYLMIPPNFNTADLKNYIKKVGAQYAYAVQETGVKYAVNLSSIGAHLENGLGPTGANFYVEQKLNEIVGLNVLHLRPGMFMSNFFGAVSMIKYQNMLGNNFSGSVKLPLTHPADIADVAFNALNDFSISGKQIQYIVSDEKNGFEIANVLGLAVERSDVSWVEFTDEQLLSSLVQNGYSEEMARTYMVEIGEALRDGSFTEDYNRNKLPASRGISLQDFAKEFAAAYWDRN